MGAGAWQQAPFWCRPWAAPTATTAPSAADQMTFTMPHTETGAAAESAAPLLAQLPAHLLHIAAQFASKDAAKEAITVINIKRDGEQLRIASTNGHYAFRCRIAADPDCLRGAWLLHDELSLRADNFRKRCNYAQQVLISANGEARFFGAKRGEALGLLEGRPYGVLRPAYQVPFPPSFDQLWPDSHSNTPGAPVAFDASYMAEICAVVSRYSENSVLRWESNAPTTPLTLTATTEQGERLEFLLMPVQVRS